MFCNRCSGPSLVISQEILHLVNVFWSPHWLGPSSVFVVVGGGGQIPNRNHLCQYHNCVSLIILSQHTMQKSQRHWHGCFCERTMNFRAVCWPSFSCLSANPRESKDKHSKTPICSEDLSTHKCDITCSPCLWLYPGFCHGSLQRDKCCPDDGLNERNKTQCFSMKLCVLQTIWGVECLLNILQSGVWVWLFQTKPPINNEALPCRKKPQGLRPCWTAYQQTFLLGGCFSCRLPQKPTLSWITVVEKKSLLFRGLWWTIIGQMLLISSISISFCLNRSFPISQEFRWEILFVRVLLTNRVISWSKMHDNWMCKTLSSHQLASCICNPFDPWSFFNLKIPTGKSFSNNFSKKTGRVRESSKPK